MITFQTRQLSEALLAVAGIWLLVRQVPDYTTSLYVSWSQPSWAQTPGAPNFLTIHGLHFLISALIGLALVLGRKPISRWLTPSQSTNEATGDVLIAIGIAIIGVFYAAEGGITLGTYYASLEQLSSTHSNMFWNGCFSVGMGVFLFAFSVGLGRLWLLLRGRVDLDA